MNWIIDERLREGLGRVKPSPYKRAEPRVLPTLNSIAARPKLRLIMTPDRNSDEM